MQTIVSYPKRGDYGDSNYRGNTSGFLLKDLFKYFKPQRVLDPMAGSGTTGDVCREMGIECTQLDLRPKFGGWDALSDEVPHSSDFIFWHPPYYNMVTYSGREWGQPDDRDLSRATSYKDFLDKLNKIQAKLISSLKTGGRIAILIGDMTKNGNFYPIQKDMQWYGTPEKTIIKAQNNYKSGRKDYNGSFIETVHEFLLIFKKDNCYVIPGRMIKHVNINLQDSNLPTWRDVVQSALEKLGGTASLKQLYQEVRSHQKTENNNNWKAKIRQVVGQYDDFKAISRGTYKMAV